MSGWLGSLLLVVLALLAAEGGPIGGLHDGWAQTAGSTSSANAMQGEITARQGYDIRINHQAYTLHRDVIIKDDEGRPKNLADLTPGATVTFQVKQGQINEIVVVMPR
ncbi:MAG: hypothetical protein ACREIS_07275 [Nitrospiraceae bacterium]